MIPLNTDLFKNNKDLDIIEVEIASNYVSKIRSSVFRILSILLENEYLDIAKQLRRNIFYTLKASQENWKSILVNTPFEHPEVKISRVYGEDIEEAVNEINVNIDQVAVFGNPMSIAIKDFFIQNPVNKFYVLYIESRLKTELEVLINSFRLVDIDIKIITKISEYKELNEFHTLVFIGSIRADDYTSIPSYILRNTKFFQIVQFKWVGQKNDYTPFITPISRLRLLLSDDGVADKDIIKRVIKKPFVLNGDFLLSNKNQDNIDEYELYNKFNLDSSPALSFELSAEKVVFYSPNSKLICILNEPNELTVHYLKAVQVADLDTSNIFIVSFDVPNKYLNERDIGSREYQEIWKNVLSDQDFSSFQGALERSNISVKNLKICLDDWCTFSESVVKAPQDKSNFIILLKCMNADLMSYLDVDSDGLNSWIEDAWQEVLISRGEAISGGLQHSFEYEESVYKAIEKFIETNCTTSSSWPNEGFSLNVDSERCEIKLYQLNSIEFGYDVPKTILKQIISVQESSSYR